MGKRVRALHQPCKGEEKRTAQLYLCMHVTKYFSKEELIEDTQVVWPGNSTTQATIHVHMCIKV